jgi:hypothetical protein
VCKKKTKKQKNKRNKKSFRLDKFFVMGGITQASQHSIESKTDNVPNSTERDVEPSYLCFFHCYFYCDDDHGERPYTVHRLVPTDTVFF